MEAVVFTPWPWQSFSIETMCLIFFQTHSLDPKQGVSDLAHQLRHVVVNEWQSNPQDYDGFVG